MAAENVVMIRNLSKIYQQGEINVTALNSISLDIRMGEFLALMGPSGSGKSTLLHIIAGIDRPTDGQCVVQGTDVTRLNESELADWRNQNVGFVFQTFNLIPVLSAYENVELPLLLTRLSRKQRREHVGTVLEVLRSLRADAHKTIIMVTHDPKAAAFGSRSIHLEKGELLPRV